MPFGATQTGDVDVFINGTEASQTGTGGGGGGVALNSTNTDFHIGKWSGQAGNFNGMIDDVQFYAAGLSNGEIQQLFNTPGQTLVPEPGTFALTALGLFGWMLCRRLGGPIR